MADHATEIACTRELVYSVARAADAISRGEPAVALEAAESAHVAALRAMLADGGRLPVNVKVIIEG